MDHAPRTTAPLRSTLRASLALLALVCVLLGATSALGITRNSVLSRAQVRVDKPVPYSQSKSYAGYRTDCSGYVSMCWATGTSYNTRTFHQVSHRIPVSSLEPGDALLKKGYHIRLFYGWVDESHTQYISYESASGVGIAGTRVHSIAEDLGWGYVPVRYDRIASSPTSSNLLKNPTFNVWSTSWGHGAETPVWWETAGPWYQTFTAHRKNASVTGRNSLELLNPSGDPATYTELAQNVAITPGASYRVRAWTKSGSDPNGIELRLAYLGADGVTLTETSTTGSAAGVNSGSFARMTTLLSAPAEAVRARVTVRLAGSTVLTAAGPAAGTSVVLDDMALYRPQVSVGIKTSRTTAYRGKTVVLSGSVSPAGSIGTQATLYVKKPGSTTYKKLATPTIGAKDDGAAWRTSYAFTRTMRRGTYRFRISVPAIPGYLADTSDSVSVNLK